VFPRYILIGMVLLFIGTAMSCAPGNDRWNSEIGPGARANFWAGVWHGLIIIVTFVVGLFASDVGVYEVRNVGWGYDLGFLIGLSLLFGPILKAGGHKKHITKRDWDRIGEKIEERVRKGIKAWLDEANHKEAKEREWEEIASRIEEKIKDALKDWK
jgi:low affinity Fe/Cu permease